MTKPRDAKGRIVPGTPPPEPHAPLLEMLRFIARASVRSVYNCPRTTVHVERMVLHWLMHWDPIRDQAVRQFIGLKASNEARKIRAMAEARRTEVFGRSHDLMRLASRSHRSERPERPDLKGRDVPNGTS